MHLQSAAAIAALREWNELRRGDGEYRLRYHEALRQCRCQERGDGVAGDDRIGHGEAAKGNAHDNVSSCIHCLIPSLKKLNLTGTAKFC